MKTISTMNLNLRNHRRRISGALLLALVAGGGVGLDRLMPRLPDGLRSQSRLGWYLRSGQLQADMRTAVAVADYVFSPDEKFPPMESPANHQVVDASLPPLPAACADCAHDGNPS